MALHAFGGGFVVVMVSRVRRCGAAPVARGGEPLWLERVVTEPHEPIGMLTFVPRPLV